MKKLGLHCSIRQAKRKREIKNINTKFLNISNRDYDGKINDICEIGNFNYFYKEYFLFQTIS